MFDANTAHGTLQAILAAASITWALQLQFIWRAFDNVVRPRGWLTAGILFLLVLGSAAILTPIFALALQSGGHTGASFRLLFWTSVWLTAILVVGLFGLYFLLTLIFFVRGRRARAMP